VSSITAFLPLERNRWFRDRDGILSTTKREDEIVGMTIDWSRQLASGETISSVAYEDSGVTRTGTSATTTTTVDNVTGIGETEVTVTLSTGRKLQELVRFYDREGARAGDYR
jgi:hypothetical protein